MPAAAVIYRLGCTVGLTGGAAFVLANRSALPPAASWGALILWLVLVGLAVWAVWLRARPIRRAFGKPGPHAGLVYALACAAMVAVVMAGSRLLTSWGHPGAVPALVALAVGLHFLPFAGAFAAPFFRRLGTVMAAVGAAGVAAQIALGGPLGALAAVVAGLTMTAMVARDALAASA